MPNSLPNCAALVIRPDRRPLFAFHHKPAGTIQRTVAIVMCPPIGFEALSVYRTYRHAAERLAGQGFHVLRFDYFGTGNSAGEATDDTDPVVDVHAAIEELKHISGVTEVCLLGTRAGALLALATAAERTDVASVVLFAMPATGRAYVREQKAFQSMSSGDDAAASGEVHVAGFTLGAALLQRLTQVDPSKLVFTRLPRVLILSRDDIADDGRLLRHLTEQGCQVRQVAVAGYASMMTLVESSQIPKRVLDSLLDWCNEFHAAQCAIAPTVPTTQGLTCEVTSADANVAVVEEALWFGPRQKLFGVITRPQLPVTALNPRRAVVLLNVGANHHVGSGRLYVTMAREMAAHGLYVLRFDVAGLGESHAAPGKAENVIYDPDSVMDVHHALHCLAERYQIVQFILGGICLGAHLAFYAAVNDPRVIAQIPVNLAVFEQQPPVLNEQLRLKSFKSRSTYVRAIFSLSTWRRVLTGQVAVVSVGAHLTRQSLRMLMSASKRRVYGWLRLDVATNPVEHNLRVALRHGVRTLLLYSEGDPALDGLKLYFGPDAVRVRQFRNFDMRQVCGADHTFNQLPAQRLLRTIMLEFVCNI